MNKLNRKDLSKYISYDKDTNLSRCLAQGCNTLMVGKKQSDIHRHWCTIHHINILELAEDVEVLEFDNSVIQEVEYNPENQYDDYATMSPPPADYATTSTTTGHNMDLLMNMEEKPYKKFIVADYVDYRPTEHISKCLIKKCERGLSGRRTGNIKRHYLRVHKFIIVHYNHFNDDSDDLEEYYESEEFENSHEEDTEDLIKSEPLDEDEQICSTDFLTEDLTRSDADENDQFDFRMILARYVDYDSITNKSRCLVPNCNRYLEGKKLYNIKRHYSLLHNCEIDKKTIDLNKLKTNQKSKITKNSSIPVEDLLIYDTESNTYQCLFINCNLILQKSLPLIKRHYREHHKIIIAKESENMENHPLLQKRKYQHTYRMQPPAQDYFVKEEPLITNYDKSESWYDYAISNYDDEQPHCSTSKKVKLSLPKKTPLKVEISLTKEEFLKLCLGLIIERDMPLSLFDDNAFFKPLLAPYEQLFNCHLNASIMETIMIKLNEIIVADLKEIFANKVICLELIVIHQNGCYYLVFNVRYIEEGITYNKLIGITPITKSTADSIEFQDYLNKFNINNDQVYATTITVTNTQPYESELNLIRYKICDYNCFVKNNPLYEFQKILNIFINKFKEDVIKWKTIAEYEEETPCTDTMENFKRFKDYLKSFNEDFIKQQPELENSLKFIQTIQICWNFMEKSDSEQYVMGDLYRDWLCCELELKELMKHDNQYAGLLNEEISKCRRKLIDGELFVSGLYLDPRFNFLGSRILNETQKNFAKKNLLNIQEKFGKYLLSFSSNNDNSSNNISETNDDEYALLTQHINDTMPNKANLCLQDKLRSCMSTKREPFNLDILKYWRYNRNDLDLNQLSQIAFTFPVSQYTLKTIEKDFMMPTNDIDKFDKFLIKHNYNNILEKNIDLIFECLK